MCLTLQKNYIFKMFIFENYAIILPNCPSLWRTDINPIYKRAAKSLALPTSLSIVFSVQETGGSPTGQYPENRVGAQDIGSPGWPVSSGLQVPGETFPSWSG
jgi:hypothetical protein